MGLPKFFVAPGSVRGSFLTLEGENAAHARVLRLRQGDRVLVCDGCGTDYSCTISDISPQQVCLVVDSASASASEPRVQCSVYMAYAKADKLEHVIQKATELGAGEIVAFPSSRCVARLDEKTLAKKLERWQKIAASAAEQSGRGRIPQVRAVRSFREAVLEAAERELLEETGFAGENPHIIGKVCPNPAIQHNTCYVVKIDNVRRVSEPQLEDTEDIEHLVVPQSKVREFLRSGAISHGIVLNALFFYLMDQCC